MRLADPRATVRGAVMCAGGGVTVAGSLLPWMTIVANVGVEVTELSTGLDLSGGWVSLVAGSVVLIAGSAAIASGGARWAGISGVLAASAAIGAAVYEWVEIRRETGEIPAALAGQIDVSIGLGLFMVLAGGLLGLAGGIATFSARH